MKNLDLKDKIFGIFFLIFFTVLIIMVRTGNKNIDDNIDNNSSSSDINEIESNDEDTEDKNIFSVINNNNYQYTYTIEINGKKEIISGKIYNNKELFTIISNVKEEYERIGTNYLKIENGNYKNIDSVRDYFKYLDMNNLDEVLSVSKVDYNDDVYTFTIDITDLIDLYNFGVDYDPFYDYKFDSAIITIKDDLVSTISFDYSSYYSFINNNDSIFKVTMEFSNYGSIEDFDL